MTFHATVKHRTIAQPIVYELSVDKLNEAKIKANVLLNDASLGQEIHILNDRHETVSYRIIGANEWIDLLI